MAISRIDETQHDIIKDNFYYLLEMLSDDNATAWEKIIANCIKMRMNDLICETIILQSALNKERQLNDKLTKENNAMQEEMTEIKTELSLKNNTVMNYTDEIAEKEIEYRQIADRLNVIMREQEKLKEDNSNLGKLIAQYKNENSQLTNRLAEELNKLKSKNAEINALTETINAYRKDYYEYSEGLVAQYDETIKSGKN